MIILIQITVQVRKKKTHLKKQEGMPELPSLANENREKYPIFFILPHVMSHTGLL